MTYEKEIPEYALQPAKAPQFTRAEAVYHTENMHYPVEKKVAEYQFEEDILVPDTKADMREILFIDASCDVQPMEKTILPKTDDVLGLTGMITVQTIYLPDHGQPKIETITSKIPYKYPWNLNPPEQGEGAFSCRVKAIEHMVINERKFRVKVTLEFCCRLFCQKAFRFFDGLKDDDLEMKREEVPLVCLELVKQDLVAVDELFRPRDTDQLPEKILKQSFSIIENYRQVTTEKVVMNGFLFVHLLYMTKGDEDRASVVCEHHQRIEFTQFVPIDKDHRGKKWSTVKPIFSPHNLAVVIETEQDETHSPCFHVKGDINTRLEFYGNKVQKMVVDAYHREKEFLCRFDSASFLNLADGAIAEQNMREVVNLGEGCKVEDAISCISKVLDCQWKIEPGKLSVWGRVESACLWKDTEGNYHSTKHVSDMQHTVDMERLEKDMTADCQPLIKNSYISLINEKQLELNYTLLFCCESYTQKKLVLLEDPGFSNMQRTKDYPMVVTTLAPGETLWDLAKQYRTTEMQIRTVNRMEGEPLAGQKILVMK